MSYLSCGVVNLGTALAFFGAGAIAASWWFFKCFASFPPSRRSRE